MAEENPAGISEVDLRERSRDWQDRVCRRREGKGYRFREAVVVSRGMRIFYKIFKNVYDVKVTPMIFLRKGTA